MSLPIESPYLVPFDNSFRIADSPSQPPSNAPGKKDCKELLEKSTEELADLQRMLYAQDEYSVLLVFQAMDAGGKDSTIRKVLTGVNPAGFQVFSFKQPSAHELDHDFLWRTAQRLPERGRIGVFNRSHYEEVLVVRVHPDYLDYQRLPDRPPLDELWQQRFDSIREHERHAARNGTLILKFWLNVSRDEQRNRFLSRLDEPHKNWKFSSSDVKERGHWDEYMHAYEQALNATSRDYAPWYAIPANDKHFMRATVSDIIVRSLRQLNLAYPTVADEDAARFDEMRRTLNEET